MTRCEKCGYESSDNSEMRKKFGLDFCNVCYVFAPNEPEKLDEYIEEKINSEEINPFRKYAKLPGENQKNAMIKKASDGFSMSRPPFGYRYRQGKLIPAENSEEVYEIFDEFVNTQLSLRKIAQKHNLSVNGLKKILRNFAYIGKIRFNNEIFDSQHKPLISSTLFNHAQNKLDNIEKTKNPQ